LSKSIPLLLDATNLAEHHRERLYLIANRLQLKLIIVGVEAPPEVVQKRLQARFEHPDPLDMSDADFEVYQRMKSRVQRIRRNHFVVDTSRDITPVIEKIVRQVRR
jgi:predicted kinase